MTVNNDTINNSLQQLKPLLFHEDFFNEIESHPLINLRDQLQMIYTKSQLITIDEQQKLLSTLHDFEINCFYNFIKQYSSVIPSTILTALFDIIRLQMNINMRINPSISDYYFNLSLTYLISNSTIEYLINQKEDISLNIDEYFLYFFSSIGSHSIYTKTNISYSICVSHQNIPTFFQLNNSTERLLQAFLTYLNNYQQGQSYISILKWLVNMTNIYGFIPYFVKTDYPNAILQWMSNKRDLSLQSWFLIINLLHNLARHWMGVKALNKLKAIKILKQWKEQYLIELSILDYNENNKDILITYYLVYSVLLEPKELKKENISNIQTVLDYILDRTIQAFNSTDLCCGSYNVCEYLSGLAKFVVNDTFLIYIISRENIYELFIEKFFLFNTLCQATELNTIICSLLYTIFWSISFQSEYNIKLKSDEKFLLLIEQTATTQSNNEHALVMRRAAKGILFNLDRIQMDVQPMEDYNTNNQLKLMISYAHKDTNFCKKLVANIREHFQGEIWVDFNKLSSRYEDDWEEIAKAITQCDVILMIVTENYCSSKSCRREVIHADKRNKRMVPIYQGKDYKPEDWFEIRVGSATWVRFGDKKSDEEVMDILLGLINIQNNNEIVLCHKSNFTNEHLINDSQTIETSLPVNSNPNLELSSNPITTDIVSTLPIEQWTCEEVQQWLHLPPSILQLTSGRALLTYMNLLSHKDAQYDEYEHRMRDHGVSREQFSNLISSFTSNHSLQNIETTSNESFDHWTREEIKYWFEQNHLSDHLLNTFDFIDGSQLLTYAKLIVHSPSRIDEEYERLRNRIGKELFHLDEYARLLNGLKKLVNRSKTKEEPALCIIL